MTGEESTHAQHKFGAVNSLLAGGYCGFHRGKPVPFANRAPSWIFEARAPGYERASAKVERGGRGREGGTACWKTRPCSGQNLNPVHQQTGFLIGQGNNS